MSPLDAALREYLRDLVRTEVVPAIREELRAVSSQAAAEDQAEYLTPAEAAAIAKVDDDTVRGWIREGVLAAARLPDGRQYRIIRADLDALLRPDPHGRAAGPDPDAEAARVMSLAQARMARRKGDR